MLQYIILRPVIVKTIAKFCEWAIFAALNALKNSTESKVDDKFVEELKNEYEKRTGRSIK